MSAFIADRFSAAASVNDASNTVGCGSALAMSKASHAGKIILLDTAGGSTATLPASTGSGCIYSFLVSVLATSNSHIIKVANGTDIIQGIITTTSDDTGGAGKGWLSAADSDTITLNRSTTGSVSKGEFVSMVDASSGVYIILHGRTASSGTEATPFSAGV